jgi:hypothetical protein
MFNVLVSNDSNYFSNIHYTIPYFIFLRGFCRQCPDVDLYIIVFILNACMNTRQNLGFGSLHILGFRFSGIFQLRLATDPDPSGDPRGHSGWTRAYGNEPDLDRVIRFNNPVSPRSFTPRVGVHVTEAYIDGQHLNDSIIHKTVNLGPSSFFDGSNGADGHEPIINFELHVGNNEDYLYGQPQQPPVGNGTHSPSYPLPNYQSLLESRQHALQSSPNPIDVERLRNISFSLSPIYLAQVDYQSILNSNIKFSPGDSELIKTMEQRQINTLSLTIHFYGYDGDGLVGYVNGEVSGNYR